MYEAATEVVQQPSGSGTPRHVFDYVFMMTLLLFSPLLLHTIITNAGFRITTGTTCVVAVVVVFTAIRVSHWIVYTRGKQMKMKMFTVVSDQSTYIHIYVLKWTHTYVHPYVNSTISVDG